MKLSIGSRTSMGYGLASIMAGLVGPGETSAGDFGQPRPLTAAASSGSRGSAGGAAWALNSSLAVHPGNGQPQVARPRDGSGQEKVETTKSYWAPMTLPKADVHPEKALAT